jgi:Leucine-rich repeat (LRR) protein
LLSTLDISHNQLSQFPDSFYTIRSLTNVDISHNKISGAVDLQAFKQLESLNISNQTTDSTSITSITFGEENLYNLVHLEADSNDINNFILHKSRNKNTFKRLETAKLNSNQFAELPNFIYDCSVIHTLDLSNNKIGSIIPLAYQNPVMLEYFFSNLDKFGFTWFMNPIPSLEVLNLSNNEIIGLDQLNNIPNIRKLDLSHNQLIRFPLFNNNENLIELDLSNNQIQTLVHFTRSDSTTLSFQKIDLSHNQIRIFEPSDKKYIHLKELNLSNNQLTSFHCNFYPSLRSLDLSNNNLTEIITHKTANYLYLKELNLSNNPSLKNIPTELFDSFYSLKMINIKNTNLNSDLLLFLTQYCKSKNIRLIK